MLMLQLLQGTMTCLYKGVHRYMLKHYTTTSSTYINTLLITQDASRNLLPLCHYLYIYSSCIAQLTQ
jgi:hypothetical protein